MIIVVFGGHSKDRYMEYAIHHGLVDGKNIFWAGEPAKLLNIHEPVKGIILGDEVWTPYRQQFIYARRILEKICRFYNGGTNY